MSFELHFCNQSLYISIELQMLFHRPQKAYWNIQTLVQRSSAFPFFASPFSQNNPFPCLSLSIALKASQANQPPSVLWSFLTKVQIMLCSSDSCNDLDISNHKPEALAFS